MHELSIVQNIVETADAFARENEIRNIQFLTVTIGANTGVIPRYVRMYYKDLCADTALEGSELRIEEMESECFCRECGEVFKPGKKQPQLITCPACGGDDLEVLHGNELMIKEIGYE